MSPRGPWIYTAEEAARRLHHLRMAGFDEEAANKIFEAIDVPAPEKIDATLAALADMGFADPVKMITSLPAILGLAIDNIRGKIVDLKALGFAVALSTRSSFATAVTGRWRRSSRPTSRRNEFWSLPDA